MADDPAAWADTCANSQAWLVDHLRSIDPVEPTRPTRLAGWSVGHLLTHIARNADSYRSLATGGPQYEGGWAQRNDDIEAGASRTWSELIDDVARSASLLDEAFAAVADWGRLVPMLMGGAQPIRYLPPGRQREVEAHRADLDLGYELADIPAAFIETDLSLLQRWSQARNDEPTLP